jgi:hypothetical protein
MATRRRGKVSLSKKFSCSGLGNYPGNPINRSMELTSMSMPTGSKT